MDLHHLSLKTVNPTCVNKFFKTRSRKFYLHKLDLNRVIMQRSCGKLLWEILAGGKLLQENLVGKSCGKFLGNSCGKLFLAGEILAGKKFLAGNCCRKILREIVAGKSCGKILREISCRKILWEISCGFAQHLTFSVIWTSLYIKVCLTKVINMICYFHVILSGIQC